MAKLGLKHYFFQHLFHFCLNIFFLQKLPRFLLKVDEFTTEQQNGQKKCPKNIIKKLFFAWRVTKASVEGQSPPQELKVSPCRGLYLPGKKPLIKIEKEIILKYHKHQRCCKLTKHGQASLITDPPRTSSTTLWHVKPDMWHLTPDAWHVTHAMWHKSCDTWLGLNILSKCQLPSS